MLKVLKAENVQDTDGVAVMLSGLSRFENGLIDLLHNPHKHPTVEPLDEGIPYILTLLRRHRRHHHVAVSHQTPGGQRVLQQLLVHFQESAGTGYPPGVTNLHRVQIINHSR